MKSLCDACYILLMYYAYIDESGDTGYTKKSSRYFILTVILVEDNFMLNRIVRKVFKSKKDKATYNMLHAFRENRKIKNSIIKELEGVDIKCVVFRLDKKRVFTQDPYVYLLDKVIHYLRESNNISICISQKDTRKDYNIAIIRHFKSHGLAMNFSRPTAEKSLQIADFYSWCVFAYLENADHEYYLKIKNRISMF